MAFKVPEDARRTSGPMATMPGEGLYGLFVVPAPTPGWELFIIAVTGAEPGACGWDHVSVHARSTSKAQMRVPTWREMCLVKDLFWDEDDVVVQFHPAKRDYVNCHPAVLHLWRPVTGEFPVPPSHLVGPGTT